MRPPSDPLLEMVGVPYGWGHKGLLGGEPVMEQDGKLVPAPYFGFDCSGFAAWAGESLRPDPLRAAWDSRRMLAKLTRVESPQPWDLALYDGHVMVVLAVARSGRVLVVGASGGGKGTTTLEAARLADARVRVRETHLYRTDFLGFRSWTA